MLKLERKIYHPLKMSQNNADQVHLLNHHCNPNAEIWEIADIEEGLVVAKCDIAAGEEITFDYETTESILAAPFKCDCHGNWIRGKDYKVDESGMDYSGAFESDIK